MAIFTQNNVKGQNVFDQPSRKKILTGLFLHDLLGSYT